MPDIPSAPPAPPPEEARALAVARLITTWQLSPDQHKRIAAQLAVWLSKEPPCTIVPAPEVIIANHDRTTTPATAGRAVRLLENEGMVARNPHDGHYYASPAQGSPDFRGPGRAAFPGEPGT